MKLIGSIIEQELRMQLEESNHMLFNSEEKKPLLEALKKSYPKMNTAYIIHWIPEQGEDLYTILINDNIISKVELEHDINATPLIRTLSLSQYLHGLRKRDQIELAVALDLAKRDLGNHTNKSSD